MLKRVVAAVVDDAQWSVSNGVFKSMFFDIDVILQ